MFKLFGRNDKLRFPFASATTSDRGFVRRANEDSFLELPEDGFYCVSDGMGGGDGGALASRWICEALSAAMGLVRESAYEIKPFVVTNSLQEVNDRIRAYAREHGYRMMGATVALVMFDPAQPSRAHVCHAGDSRVYRLRNGKLAPLTHDHTVGNELGQALSKNAANRAADLQSRRNPLTHILTRAVGTEMRPRPDISEIDVRKGDRFLLCSDGVHDMLLDEEIEPLVKSASSPADAISRLEAAVRKAGASDNYTMVCVFA